MSRRYKFGDDDKLYFMSTAVVNWIDVFTRIEYKEILLDSWRFCQQNKGLEIFSWVIMPNHIHLIIGSNRDPVSGIVRDMKSYSSRKIKEAIETNPHESRKDWLIQMMRLAGARNSANDTWQLWQQHNHPLELYDRKIFLQKMDYVHSNPVTAGFVRKDEDWKFSSAGDFHGLKGPIELSYLA